MGFSTAFWVYLLIFLGILLFGGPIYMALLCSGMAYVFIHGRIDQMAVMAKMYGSLDSFVLLAIPMFMASGIVMNVGGITDRIFDFCRKLLGHLPGGLAYVNVVASFIFSGMSGSALADVGGLGQVEIKAMRDEGIRHAAPMKPVSRRTPIGDRLPEDVRRKLDDMRRGAK